MYIDVDAKTVTFVAGTTLCLDQLRAITAILDDGHKAPLALGPVDSRPGMDHVRRIKLMSSDSRRAPYVVVQFQDGTMACSCPDWIHRRSIEGTVCKHILRFSLYG